MRSLAVAVVALTLVGCATTAERRQARIDDAMATCTVAGFRPQTDAMAQCVSIMYSQAQARREANAMALIGMGLGTAAASQQPAYGYRPTTICTYVGNSIVCN